MLYMDELVKKHTGFHSWQEMKEEMEQHGFVPVVVNEEFRDSLVRLGYKVTDGVLDRTKEV